MLHSIYILRLFGQSPIYGHLVLDFSSFLLLQIKIQQIFHIYLIMQDSSWIHTKCGITGTKAISYLLLGNKLFQNFMATYNNYYYFFFNKEKYLFVPCTIFESCYCYSIFGIYYSAGCKVNKRKAYWINELQDEWNDTVISWELKFHYSDPSRQPWKGSGYRRVQRMPQMCLICYKVYQFSRM